MVISKTLQKDIKTMASRMPVCFIQVNGQMIKVNHKKRLNTVYQRDGFRGINTYAGKVANALKYSEIKKTLPLLDA